MRVTNKMLVRTFLNNLSINRENMSKYQEQLSSGKEIRRPSDNPFAVARAMTLNSTINRNDQYRKNIEDSAEWLNTTDMALGQMGDALQRIRELMIAASNGTNAQSEIDAYKAEILQRIDEISQIGNTVFDGRYIFGGTSTTEPPFSLNDGYELVYGGNSADIIREISPNVTIKINIAGTEIMNGKDIKGNALDLKKALSDVVDSLTNGQQEKLGGSLLKDIQDNIDNVLRLRAEAGARANRMESAKAKNEEETLNITELLSKTADIDIAKKVMEYKVMENVYQASLMAGAKIIQPSLVDFLR